MILLESPPPPERFGLDAATTLLEVWTELFEPPARQAKTSQTDPAEAMTIAGESQPVAESKAEIIDFGDMQIGSGNAFRLGNTDAGGLAPMRAQWIEAEGRTFLVESIAYAAIRNLSSSGRESAQASAAMRDPGSSGRLPAPRPEALLVA